MALACVIVHTTDRAVSSTFYVSPQGNDAWSGKLAAPNAKKTDGPYATVTRAQQAVRELKREEDRDPQPICVYLRGGTYYLPEPLVFTPEDAGTAAAPILYAAYAGEHPVLNGGTPITGWRVVDKRWETTLPEVAQGKWNFIQLFVNGERRYRPRLPKQGYFTIAGQVPPPPDALKASDSFIFHAGEIRPDWANLRDVEVLAFQVWTMARMRIADVDDAQLRVRFTGTSCPGNWWGFEKGKRFLVENVREALSAPGEWYLDRPTGVLTYLPRPGERPDTAAVIAPRLDRLLELRGDVEAHRWVEYLTFRGLDFQYVNWVTPPRGENSPQAETTIPAAITAMGARNCALERCTVAHTGTYGIDWQSACRDNRVEECDLYDLGAGGMKIGNASSRGVTEELAVERISVRQCRLVGGGRLHPAGVGIWLGCASNCTLARNQVVDFYYSGISVGWVWGYDEPSRAHDNLIASNYIARIGQGVMSDMGGIYTLGVSPGTVIQGNVVDDVEGLEYGGWGIYFDEGSSGIIATDNVTSRTSSAGFFQHYGKDNVVTNNVFSFAKNGQIQRSRMEPHRSFTFERNIIYWDIGPAATGNWTDKQYVIDHNLYWRTDDDLPVCAGKTWEEWQQQGNDTHSIVADPGFVNPAKGDYRLLPESPAAGLGIHPLRSQADTSPAPFAAPRAYPSPGGA